MQLGRPIFSALRGVRGPPGGVMVPRRSGGGRVSPVPSQYRHDSLRGGHKHARLHLHARLLSVEMFTKPPFHWFSDHFLVCNGPSPPGTLKVAISLVFRPFPCIKWTFLPGRPDARPGSECVACPNGAFCAGNLRSVASYMRNTLNPSEIVIVLPQVGCSLPPLANTGWDLNPLAL